MGGCTSQRCGQAHALSPAAPRPAPALLACPAGHLLPAAHPILLAPPPTRTQWHETLVAVKILLKESPEGGHEAALTLSSPELHNLHKECSLMARE